MSGEFERISHGGKVLKDTTAMAAEREALKMGVENLMTLFPVEAKEFQFVVENESRETEYKVDTQSLRLFDLCNDRAEDVHRADANRLGQKNSGDDAAPPSCIGAKCTSENPVKMFTDDLSSTVTRRSACNQYVPFRFCNFKCETLKMARVAVLAGELNSITRTRKNTDVPFSSKLETLATGSSTLDSIIVEPILFIFPAESRFSQCTLLYPRCSIEDPSTEYNDGAVPFAVTSGA